MLEDYSTVQDILRVSCDNTSAINISRNPIQHSRNKYIDIRHHFIHDLETISLECIETENQLVDNFTKALDTSRFDSLRKALGVGST